MASDLSKITIGPGPSAARLQLLIERAIALSRGMAAMPLTSQNLARMELQILLKRITEAARDTADGIEAAADRISRTPAAGKTASR